MTGGGSHWKVWGAQRESGADMEIVVRAADGRAAETEAVRLGILVSRVERVDSPASEPTHATPPGAIVPAVGERLVRVYATRPRDHLYIGWMLRHRKQLVVTSHRVVLHERFLFSSRTATLDVGAMEGALVGRVVRWRVLIATALLAVSGVQVVPFLFLASSGLALVGLATLGVAVLIGLVLSRPDFVGVTSAGGRLGLVRHGVGRGVGERFLTDVHSVLRAGSDAGLLGQVLAEGLREQDRVCPACRYPLAGLEHAAVCPECGVGLTPRSAV